MMKFDYVALTSQDVFRTNAICEKFLLSTHFGARDKMDRTDRRPLMQFV